jgi:DNA repair exonuclease SbcCD ATPase subunit
MDKQTLEIAEYFALAGSAVGSVVAAASGQVLFAAAPLTVALSLNLANRRKVDHQIQQYTTEAITQAYQVVRSLQQEVQTLPAINRRLNDLDQQFYTRPETQAVGQLEGAIAQLSEQLNDLSLRHSSTPQVDLSGVEQAITYINGQLETLTVRLDRVQTPQEADLTGIAQVIADIQEQLNELTLRFEQLQTPQEANLI